MGSSIPQHQQTIAIPTPPTSLQTPQIPKQPIQEHAAQLSQPSKEVSIVQNIVDTSNIETIDDYTKIAPQKIRHQPRKSGDCSAALLQKARRQLPPLKKIRSLKKVDAQQNMGKENSSKKVLEVFLQKDSIVTKGSTIQISELKQTENQDINKVKQTRTKKMRVSKNLTALHKTLYQ